MMMFVFLIILTIAKRPINANIKSIYGLWFKPNGRIVSNGNNRQCTKQIEALEIPKTS
jgi:hypothetical protein